MIIAQLETELNWREELKQFDKNSTDENFILKYTTEIYIKEVISGLKEKWTDGHDQINAKDLKTIRIHVIP